MTGLVTRIGARTSALAFVESNCSWLSVGRGFMQKRLSDSYLPSYRNLIRWPCRFLLFVSAGTVLSSAPCFCMTFFNLHHTNAFLPLSFCSELSFHSTLKGRTRKQQSLQKWLSKMHLKIHSPRRICIKFIAIPVSIVLR